MEQIPTKHLYYRHEACSFEAMFLPCVFGGFGLFFGCGAVTDYKSNLLDLGEIAIATILITAFLGWSFYSLYRALRGAFEGSFVDLETMTFNLFKGAHRLDKEHVYSSWLLVDIIAVERHQDEIKLYIDISTTKSSIRFRHELVKDFSDWVFELNKIAPHIEHRPES
ncbi:MAG: hypothetical protein ACPG5U_04520 [Planktomarina sp.]